MDTTLPAVTKIPSAHGFVSLGLSKGDWRLANGGRICGEARSSFGLKHSDSCAARPVTPWTTRQVRKRDDER
jgi:hypothetical protein